MKRKKKNKTSKRFRWIVFLAFFFMIVIVTIFLYFKYRITYVLVEGNVHYSEEEIKGFVLREDYPLNSLYYSIKYKNKVITDIPFIERLEVSVDAPDTIRIKVYEKLLAGYVTYLGENICFDKDGIVVECTNIVPENIPHITGLHFSHMVLFDELQVEEDNVFPTILELTKTLQKYELDPTEIYFTTKQEIVLYFVDVRIHIGDTDFLDEKLGFVSEILPSLEGKKGELSLKNYSGESCSITFQEDEYEKNQ